MKLLFVDCCISQRGEDSRTRKLAKAYLDAFSKAHPGAQVETVTPEMLLALRPFDAAMLDERDALAAEKRWDAPVFDLARQLRGADAVVVAAPYWDLSFPAALRTYIEYVSANGLTYHYESDGCHGDCRAERLVYLTTGGDVEREDSVGVVHWRQLAAMFGIGRFDYVFAGGLDIVPDRAEELLAAQCKLAAALGAEE
ncbi:NAD(P)H-dependent oxidoreductase [uncultured Oscillibacter sp.]|uniref:NAD(P)H-dependent oxidoreductase n=1 Tax=uncultured Oscillibacter sp. TaxID=876091 RepID=UPI0025F58B78|nr:NAD(P)H-dependent oxidoreductase [uncultured Oscillibacter sp.]